jgi:centrosomal protein CEP41
LQKKVPTNPKYANVKSTMRTGKTVKDVETISDQLVMKRKTELFRRIKCSTLHKLLTDVGFVESIYNMGGDENEEEEIKEVRISD